MTLTSACFNPCQMNVPCPAMLRLLPLLLASSVLPAAAADISEQQTAAGVRAYYSNESERFSVNKLSTDLYADFRHLEQKTGLRYTEIRYGQDGWSRRGQQLNLLASRTARATGEGWIVDLGVLQQGQHQTVTADVSYRQMLAGRHSMEVFLNRDVVETRNALDDGRSFTFGGVSGDYVMHPQWTAVGMVGLQSFSDGNLRRHLRSRLIYQPWTELGIAVQARYRYADSSEADVGRAYFNPTRHDEGMLAVSWRSRVQGWRTQVVAGAGRQRINDDGQTATRLFEASAEQQQHTHAIRLRAGYSRSAAFGGPDYRWSYVAAELVIPF